MSSFTEFDILLPLSYYYFIEKRRNYAYSYIWSAVSLSSTHFYLTKKNLVYNNMTLHFMKS